MLLIEACMRLVPGVLGDERQRPLRFAQRAGPAGSSPQFTRPREFRGMAVPDVLLSGDHAAIAAWRAEQAARRPKARSPG